MSYFKFKSFTEVKIRNFGIFIFFLFLVLFLYGIGTGKDGKDRFGNPFLPDLAQFYVAGEMAIHGEIGKIYDGAEVWRRINETLRTGSQLEGTYFFYPPFVAWGCAPLAVFSYTTTAWFYFAASLLLGLGLSWSIANHFLGKTGTARTACWLFMASVPFWRCVTFGQNGLITLTIAWGFYLCWKAKNDYWAGLILALGAYKPQLFFGLWIWAVLFGNNRMRLGLLIGVALLWSMVVVGNGFGGAAELWGGWIKMVQVHHDVPGSAARMHSIHNAFQLMGADHGVTEALVWSLVVAACAAAYVVAWNKKKIAAERLLGFTVLTTMLITPRLYNYDVLLAFPVLVGWWAQHGKKEGLGGRWLLTIGVASFYLSDFFALLRIPVITLFGMGCGWKMYKYMTQKG